MYYWGMQALDLNSKHMQTSAVLQDLSLVFHSMVSKPLVLLDVHFEMKRAI